MKCWLPAAHARSQSDLPPSPAPSDGGLWSNLNHRIDGAGKARAGTTSARTAENGYKIKRSNRPLRQAWKDVRESAGRQHPVTVGSRKKKLKRGCSAGEKVWITCNWTSCGWRRFDPVDCVIADGDPLESRHGVVDYVYDLPNSGRRGQRRTPSEFKDLRLRLRVRPASQWGRCWVVIQESGQ